MRRQALVSIIALAWADAGWAQLSASPPAATVIIPDGLPGQSLGTTTSTLGPVTTIDGGTVAGTNLFHSFSAFDLAVGDTARWTHSAGDPANIGNVINRVTGGTPSQLFGTLDSTALPNADFFFINPAGIVFGDGAQVNVPAAAHFSTASNLHFANGETFAIATPDGSTLSVAPPAAFGFLGNEAEILFSAAGFFFPWSPEAFLPGGGSLSLTASDVTLDASYVQANGLLIAATGPTDATVGLDGSIDGALSGNVAIVANSRLEGLEVNGGTGNLVSLNAGTVSLEGSEISTRGGTFGVAGPIAVHADELTMSASRIASIGVDTAFTFTAAAGPIDIDTGTLSMTNSFIESSNFGAGTGGDVTIDVAGQLFMDGSWIVADNAGLDQSVGGSIVIRAAVLDMLNFSRISAVSFGDGEGGSVDVAVEGHFGMTGSNIFTGANGAGDGGLVALSASSMSITNSLIDSRSLQGGEGGDIDIDVAGLLELDFGRILSTASAPDDTSTPTAGTVSVTAHDLIMTGVGPGLESTIGSTSSGPANGGAVDINVAGSLQLTEYSTIAATNIGNGNAGTVNVSAGSATLGTGSSISSSSTGVYNVITDTYITGGNAGSVEVDVAGQLNMSGAEISSDTEDGLAGSITVAAETLTASNSRISSTAFLDGTAGTVDIATDGAIALTNTFVSVSTHGNGSAGKIRLDGDVISLTTSQLASSTQGTGDAGAIEVFASALDLVEGSGISTSTFHTGDAGTISVKVDGDIRMDTGFISSSSKYGTAGLIGIEAASLSMGDHSRIRTSVEGDGAAGAIEVTLGGDLALVESSIESVSDGGNGDAGRISLEVANLAMDRSQFSTDSFGLGAAGDVTVAAGSASLIHSDIRSLSWSTGAGGSVDVALTGDLAMNDFSSISTGTQQTADAGDVFVEARNIDLRGNSQIASQALEQGDGGVVVVETPGQLSLDGGSAILSSVGEWGNGAGDAGDVSVSASQLLMNGGSHISSDILSGDGAGGSIFIAADVAEIMGGAQITTSSVGSGDAGTIEILSGQVTLDGSTTKIASENTSAGGGQAGSVLIVADMVLMNEGARVTTNSVAGAAGDITFDMPADGLLILQSTSELSAIETSSGPGTGGVITIASPLAIISHGGSILALGESGGANVSIDTKYFISSTDRPNIVAVDGTLSFTNSIYDVSSGTVDTDLSPIDASGVLRGQCSAMRATGSVSQLNMRPIGPYGSGLAVEAPRSAAGASGGGCQ